VRCGVVRAKGHVFDESDPEKQQVEWGVDMASEHERYLCEVVFKKPVIVYNYPCAIKAFYMRRNDPGTDGAPGLTCAAMDVLVPGVGELIGGSVREERHDVRTGARARQLANPPRTSACLPAPLPDPASGLLASVGACMSVCMQVLVDAIKETGMDLEPYWWYLELRKYGTVPHAGFGLGFERLILFTTGIENIRDVIPFPRFPSGSNKSSFAI
jgi:asparaginyl-tRNA synthetase